MQPRAECRRLARARPASFLVFRHFRFCRIRACFGFSIYFLFAVTESLVFYMLFSLGLCGEKILCCAPLLPLFSKSPPPASLRGKNFYIRIFLPPPPVQNAAEESMVS